MRILCTNDDGIHARGLAFSAELCAGLGEVTTVAPDREQSATSHSLTLYRPLRATGRGERRWDVDGTPTDCVLLALGQLLPQRPDVVVSGVNHGPNMGEDVLYSGTVAAAMEALSVGIPGVAISFAGTELDLLASHRPWLERLVRDVLRVDAFPEETLLNVNLPNLPGDRIRGIRITTLGNRVFEGSILRTADPWGRPVYWIGGGQVSWTGREDCDFRAVAEGYISVTPLHVDLTNYGLLEAVDGWRLGQ